MRIVNGELFVNGVFSKGSIAFAETITGVFAGLEEAGEEDFDASDCYVIPGLIDIHTHAAVGEDASDGKAEAFPKLGRYYAHEGVTAWCPTTMTLKEPVLTEAMKAIRAYERPEDGARIAGINLEGPFVSYAKRGAQNAENISLPDADMVRRLNEASGGQVCLLTLAPEEAGALEFIREISKEVVVSLGHTTADYDTAMAAYKAGASHTTHLFNAMPPLAHREPGVIAAAMDAGASVELICDGLHIHPSVVRLTHRLYGEKMVLISDSLRCAGMPDGEYELGGQPITLKNGKATLKDSDTLAGSSIHLMDGLRRAVAFGLPLEAAVTAATIAPAKAIRREKLLGSLEAGKYADIVVLSKNLEVKAVFLAGKRIR